MADLSDNLIDVKKEVAKLEEIKEKLLKTQEDTDKDIENVQKSIKDYTEKLNENNAFFAKYSDDINNKMQLVATRNRMIQLSQERNVYKKKIIYILFSIIIALLIAVISAYTFFGNKSIK